MKENATTQTTSPAEDKGPMKLLIIRFSSLGDVAMTVPVVDSLARQYPGIDITVLTRTKFAAFFQSLPPNAHVRAVDLKTAYAGLGGMLRLGRELSREGFTHVADLHDVLRTKLLRGRFRLHKAEVAVIDKGQKEKRALTRRYRKVMRPLPTTFERYRDTLARLGLTFEPRFKSIYPDGQADITGLLHLTGEKGTNRWVGIAPIVRHKAKAYPPEQMERIVSRLHHLKDVHIFLFGGGHLEESVAHTWASTYKGVTSVIGKLSMVQELALMSHMDVMVTMDSGNMHLASLVGTPVVSIWGATHPYAGSLGWGQTADNAVQVDMPCRPCSVNGHRPCYRGDYACLKRINADAIMQKIGTYLE